MDQQVWIRLVTLVGAHGSEEDAHKGENFLFEEEPFLVGRVMNPKVDRHDFVKEITLMNRDVYEKIKEYRGWKYESKSGLVLPKGVH